MAYLIQNNVKGKYLYTTEFIPEGKIIRHLNKENVSEEITYQSIQVGKNLHFLQDDFFSNLNHSCEPTTIIDTKNYVIIANRDIRPGEELNFFYPSTEWKMAQPFHCECGSENCIGYLEGAYNVSINCMQQHFINDHIKEEIMNLVKNNNRTYIDSITIQEGTDELWKVG